jgi:Calpain family cysteine protease
MPRERQQRRTGEELAREPAAPSAAPPDLLRSLQQGAGNQAVARLLAREPTAETTPAEETDASEQALVDQLKSAPEAGMGERIEITDELISLLLGRSEPKAKFKHRNAPFEEQHGDFSGKGATPEDVSQGGLGDCYLLAALAAVARANPAAIESMIKDNGDGTYEVTIFVDTAWFSKKLEKKTIKVKPTVPTKDGKPIYAEPGEAGPSGPKLWVMLIEKAYAIHKGGYGSMEGGFGGPAMEAITGKVSEIVKTSSKSEDEIADLVETKIAGGFAITAGADWALLQSTKDKAAADGIPVLQHEYAVAAIDKGAKTIDLQNPWPIQHIKALPLAKFKKWFTELSFNPTK